jgi:hypothetical protein
MAGKMTEAERLLYAEVLGGDWERQAAEVWRSMPWWERAWWTLRGQSLKRRVGA